jgi:hypothetical protein
MAEYAGERKHATVMLPISLVLSWQQWKSLNVKPKPLKENRYGT